MNQATIAEAFALTLAIGCPERQTHPRRLVLEQERVTELSDSLAIAGAAGHGIPLPLAGQKPPHAPRRSDRRGVKSCVSLRLRLAAKDCLD